MLFGETQKVVSAKRREMSMPAKQTVWRKGGISKKGGYKKRPLTKGHIFWSKSGAKSIIHFTFTRIWNDFHARCHAKTWHPAGANGQFPPSVSTEFSTRCETFSCRRWPNNIGRVRKGAGSVGKESVQKKLQREHGWSRRPWRVNHPCSGIRKVFQNTWCPLIMETEG